MLASDALSYLVGQLNLTGMNTTPDGEVEYHFDTPFPFVLTEIDARRLAIFAPFDLPAALRTEAVMRRLLEANLQGAETGPGATCLDPYGAFGLRDVFELGDMTLEAVQLRFVDFCLYYEFWRGTGLPALLAEAAPDDPLPGGFLRL